MASEDINVGEDLGDFLDLTVTIDDPSIGSVYPMIQWVNGNKSHKPKKGSEADIGYTGGFFFSADQGLDAPPGFEPYTLVTNEGTEIEGYAARDLTVVPIRTRRCWVVLPDGGGLPKRFGWGEYELAVDAAEGSGPRGQTHLLALVNGSDEVYLMTFGGMNSRAVTSQGKERGILPRYSQQVVNRARSISRQEKGQAVKYPLCAFQLVIGPDREEDGTPKFTTVGKGQNTSLITKPIWVDAPTGLLDKTAIKRLFVGPVRFGVAQAAFQEADEWSRAWDPTNLEQLAMRGRRTVGSVDADGELPGDNDSPF